MDLIEKAKDALHLDKDKQTGDEPTPAFDPEKVMVIYVLGGPGAGKGTQCAYIAEDFGFVHLSAGDLLRKEQNREGSEFGELIRGHIRGGTLVPMEVTIKLLENAMRAQLEPQSQSHLGDAWKNGHGRFLIDGFPREMDQAIKFDETVVMPSFVLFFDTTKEVMCERLLNRGKTGEREDDNEEVINKRFHTFLDTSMPVVDKYRDEGKVIEIDSTRPIKVVHADVRKVLLKEFAKRGLPEK
ncbi:hypothetical protein FRC11_007370 [Ceratobasidium sp. 423]|nr:hypothetical protein FRC11_007370 [Ceratobasidium sp. 423]